MRIDNSLAVGILLLGLVIILLGVAYAFNSYKNYKPLLPKGNTLEEAITNSTFDLVNLAAQLAFLGVGIWGGAILLREGLRHLRCEGCPECTGLQKRES